MASTPAGAAGVTIVEYLDVAPAHRRTWLARVHDDVLRPNFPANELIPMPAFADMVDEDPSTTQVVAACDPGGRHLGCIVSQWFSSTRVLLIAYLAVRAELRGHGIGTALIQAAIPAWVGRLGPAAVVAEVEDPRSFEGMGGQDPVRRLRLYGRLGGLLVDAPYVQPEVNQGTGRVAGMLLLVAPAYSAAVVPLDGGGLGLPADLFTAFLREYFDSAEGAGYDDAQFSALVGAVHGRAVLPLHPPQF